MAKKPRAKAKAKATPKKGKENKSVAQAKAKAKGKAKAKAAASHAKSAEGKRKQKESEKQEAKAPKKPRTRKTANGDDTMYCEEDFNNIKVVASMVTSDQALDDVKEELRSVWNQTEHCIFDCYWTRPAIRVTVKETAKESSVQKIVANFSFHKNLGSHNHRLACAVKCAEMYVSRLFSFFSFAAVMLV